MNISLVSTHNPYFKSQSLASAKGKSNGGFSKGSTPYPSKTVQQFSTMLTRRADTVEISKEALNLQKREMERAKFLENENERKRFLQSLFNAINDLQMNQYLFVILEQILLPLTERKHELY